MIIKIVWRNRTFILPPFLSVTNPISGPEIKAKIYGVVKILEASSSE
jgi:hypothetical protein